MCTTLNLITNEIVYTLSNLRSRRFFREGRVIFESRKSARHPQPAAENSREGKAENRRPGFDIFEATGRLENLIDL